MKRFFERIGLAGDTPVTASVEFLGKVQSMAVMHIAYENLDILEGKALALTYEALYEKIVVNGRGGYCFELNGLLAGALRQMGFCVKERFARFLRGENEVPMRRHRVCVVSVDGKDYFMDIGVGQIAPRLPLEVCENLVQTQNGEEYRFTRDARHGWILWDKKNGQWREFVCFTDDEAFEVDFLQPSFFCEKHPDSVFNKQRMIAIKTPEGRKTLDGSVYKVFRGETLADIEEDVPECRIGEILRKEFLLKV